MRVLRNVAPTPQQLLVINDAKPGVLVLRGAAGSGKTTTALLRLRSLIAFWQRRVRDGYVDAPIQVLVLTYNKTLRGYITELAKDMAGHEDVDLLITNIDQWANQRLGRPQKVMGSELLTSALNAHGLSANEFHLSEGEYVAGRWLPKDRSRYLRAERRGRGTSPRMEGKREQLLAALDDYDEAKQRGGLLDWNDLAVEMADGEHGTPFHIVIIDEAQDFSANQVRAILPYLHREHSLAFVLDQAQRIYPRRFTWAEVGLSVGPTNSKLLDRNFRNTAEIAAFAGPLLAGLDLSDDGAHPDARGCTRHGSKPVVVTGTFSAQATYLINYIDGIVEADPEASIGVLHPKGGGWFDELRSRLSEADVPHVTLTSSSSWPAGAENVALSTMHSAKGLEFDHVAVVGFNQQTTPHGLEPGDNAFEQLRRLTAMAFGRARESVMLGYKPDEASALVHLLIPNTYDLVEM